MLSRQPRSRPCFNCASTKVPGANEKSEALKLLLDRLTHVWADLRVIARGRGISYELSRDSKPGCRQLVSITLPMFGKTEPTQQPQTVVIRGADRWISRIHELPSSRKNGSCSQAVEAVLKKKTVAAPSRYKQIILNLAESRVLEGSLAAEGLAEFNPRPSLSLELPNPQDTLGVTQDIIIDQLGAVLTKPDCIQNVAPVVLRNRRAIPRSFR